MGSDSLAVMPAERALDGAARPAQILELVQAPDTSKIVLGAGEARKLLEAAAAEDSRFWDEHVREPAAPWMVHGAR